MIKIMSGAGQHPLVQQYIYLTGGHVLVKSYRGVPTSQAFKVAKDSRAFSRDIFKSTIGLG